MRIFSGVLGFSNYFFRVFSGVFRFSNSMFWIFWRIFGHTYIAEFLRKTNFVFRCFSPISDWFQSILNFLNNLNFLIRQNFLSILNFQNFLSCQTISNTQTLWKTSQTYCPNNQNCLKTSQIVRIFKLYLFLILWLTPWNVLWYNCCTWGFLRSNYYTIYEPESQAYRKCFNIQTI